MRKVFGTGFAAAFACLVFMAAPEAVASTSVRPGGSDNAQLPISTFEIAQLKAARIQAGPHGGVTLPRANTYAIWNNATASIATFDVTAPGTLNVIGSTGIPSAQFINGLEFEPTSGKLYLTTNSATNYFFDVDIATGLASNGRGSGLSAGDTIGDLSYDHFQSRMLAVGNAGTAGSGARLYEIDLVTGDAALLGPVGNLTEGFAVSLAVRPSDGLIFLHGIETDRWYTVDPDTLQATALDPLGVNTNFGQGASFDPQSLILYHAMLTVDGGNQNRLAVIDQTNGLPAFIGTLGAGLTQIGDIAFPPSRVFSDGFEE